MWGEHTIVIINIQNIKVASIFLCIVYDHTMGLYRVAWRLSCFSLLPRSEHILLTVIDIWSFILKRAASGALPSHLQGEVSKNFHLVQTVYPQPKQDGHHYMCSI